MSRPVNLTPCSVDGCELLALKRGLCDTHYVRLRTHGDTDLHPQFAPTAERLAAGLVHKPNGCLEWTGGTDKDGYGKIRVDGKSTRTHRAAWVLANGVIPDGLHVLHHCDNPPCGETTPSDEYPEGHLFLGTTAQNNADRSAKGRSRGWEARRAVA
jgi:hypothetical protein